MSSIQIFSAINSEPFLSMGIIPWVVLCLIWCLMTIGLIYSWIRIRALKDQKGEFERQTLERAELLSYSAEREKKAIENVALANQSKQQLLSRINHEIRTPMNGVIGMSSLLAETSLNNEQQEYNETIRNCGENLLTVINDILHGDILAYSKVESGRIDLELKEFDLRNSIEEILDVFNNKAAKAELELLYQIEPDVPEQVVGDSQRFRQVLMNIIENAVKFTQHGEIFVKVKASNPVGEIINDGSILLLDLEIRDTGVGMDKARLNILVNDLHVANTSEVSTNSTGVGLFICQKLLDLMGGSMKIQSTLGEGTTVILNIPVKAGSLTPGAYAYHNFAGLEGKKVLIVDDNQTSRNILKDELEHWKLSASVAASGKQALEIISTTKDFDVVLTDMKMPEMDGIQLAESIRQQYPKLPIILLGNDGEESSNQHPELFSSVVNKPIRHDILGKHLLSKLQKQDQPNKGNKLSEDFAKKYPLRILIAEDNRVNQKLAMKILCKLGYNPDIAQDGKEVLEIVGDSKYDLILMDIRMPEMDGLEATRMIRLCLAVQPIIVAMTANSMQGDREECLRAGMEDYISKPVHLEELVIILEKWGSEVNKKNKI